MVRMLEMQSFCSINLSCSEAGVDFVRFDWNMARFPDKCPYLIFLSNDILSISSDSIVQREGEGNLLRT